MMQSNPSEKIEYAEDDDNDCHLGPRYFYFNSGVDEDKQNALHDDCDASQKKQTLQIFTQGGLMKNVKHLGC